MFKLVVVLATLVMAYADPKPRVVAAAPVAVARAVAPAVVTAQSSQVIARNYNALVAPVPAAPLVAAPAPLVAGRAPLVAAPASVFAPRAPLVAAPAPVFAPRVPLIAAPSPLFAARSPYVSAPLVNAAVPYTDPFLAGAYPAIASPYRVLPSPLVAGALPAAYRAFF